MYIFGPPNIEKLKTQHDVEGLIKALSYKKNTSLTKTKDWRNFLNYQAIRKSAAVALGEIGDRRAVEPLVEALADSHGAREAATYALAKISSKEDKPVITSLIEGLSNWDDKHRNVAAKILNDITGENLGLNPRHWQDWLEKNRTNKELLTESE